MVLSDTLGNSYKSSWFIKKIFSRYDEELIHKVCGIIEVNGFQISSAKNSIRCLYVTANYFVHGCIPNCTSFILPSCDNK